MREVKRTKKVDTTSSKVSNSYIDANGVKITLCKPAPMPKQITARGKG